MSDSNYDPSESSTSDAPSVSFSSECRAAFEQYILEQGPTHRLRFDTARLTSLKLYCANPKAPVTNPAEGRLRTLARTEYRLEDGLLYKLPDSRHPKQRRVVPHDEVFDVIAKVHVEILQHAGRDKVYNYINARYYRITKNEITWLLPRCRTCGETKSKITAARLASRPSTRVLPYHTRFNVTSGHDMAAGNEGPHYEQTPHDDGARETPGYDHTTATQAGAEATHYREPNLALSNVKIRAENSDPTPDFVAEIRQTGGQPQDHTGGKSSGIDSSKDIFHDEATSDSEQTTNAVESHSENDGGESYRTPGSLSAVSETIGSEECHTDSDVDETCPTPGETRVDSESRPARLYWFKGIVPPTKDVIDNAVDSIMPTNAEFDACSNLLVRMELGVLYLRMFVEERDEEYIEEKMTEHVVAAMYC